MYLHICIYLINLADKTTASSVENQLNDQVQESHDCATESTIVSSTKHSSNTSPLPSEGSHKTPFGCGCGKCTFFNFIERGCSTPIPSASSFPYLYLSGLTHEQQQELKEALGTEEDKAELQRYKEDFN